MDCFSNSFHEFEKRFSFIVFWGVKSIDIPNEAKIANLRFKGKKLYGL